jgi:hypothetical protein
MKSQRKPIAVLISDIHFNVHTREIATAALRDALEEADEMGVPLIIAGDLNDTKAILRAECANAIITAFEDYEDVRKIILVGNHDLVNEKGTEHSLNFLRPYADVVQAPVFENSLGLWLIPYQSNSDDLKVQLSVLPKGAIAIMHQGFKGAAMGEYVVDKTSIDPAEVAHLRVISGHYHKHQTIGTVTYIGTPYTITFAEANDGVKGILVLFSDGSFDRIGLKLRQHIIVERTPATVLDPIPDLSQGDLLWMKVEGPATELQKLNKKEIGLKHLGHQNFKLDKIYSEVRALHDDVEKLSDDQVFDRVIDDSDESPKQKSFLKQLWRELMAS